MSNWLKTCFEHFREAAGEQGFEEVEAAASAARRKGRIDAETVRVITTHEAWTYSRWWPKDAAGMIAEPVVLKNPHDSVERKKAVEHLFSQLKNLEATSVVLRFVWPEEFGILSAPVMNLLNLIPSSQLAETYLEYCDVLRELRPHYGFTSAAEVDMALWAAAHLYMLGSLDLMTVTSQIDQDEDFQKLRFRNLLRSRGSLFPELIGSQIKVKEERRRLVFAQVLNEHDHILAAMVAGRSFERLAKHLARVRGIETESEDLKSLVDELRRHPELLEKLGCSSARLDQLRRWRNQAVHTGSPIDPTESAQFIQEVLELWGKAPSR